jgi:hypothetical protein
LFILGSTSTIPSPVHPPYLAFYISYAPHRNEKYLERSLPHHTRPAETMLSDIEPTKEESVEAEPELILEDATSIRDGMRRLVRYASDATEALDARIEDENLDGRTEAAELREALESVQSLTLAYQLPVWMRL